MAVGDNLHWDFTDMLYPPTASSTALAVAFVLSVFNRGVEPAHQTGESGAN